MYKMSVNNGQTSMESFDCPELNSHIKSSVPRTRSFDNMGTLAEAKVLVIYTGGTIGMTRNSNNGMYCFNFNKFT